MNSSKLAVVLLSFSSIVLLILSLLLLFKNQLFSKNITITSQVPSIKLELQDKELLNSYFKEWGVFTKRNRYKGEIATVKNIQVVLTPEVQKLDALLAKDKKTIVQGSNYNFVKGELTIKVYLHPELVIKNMTSKDISDRILYATLIRIYKLTHQDQLNSTSSQIPDEEIGGAIYKQNSEGKILYVEKL